uniref:Uncharacterized protein n=1 Tax=Oryza nivara TaxID=4536 RepID=A0A0E0GGH7_ORYNI
MDKTSRRVCQTRGQLGTNTRHGVANTVQARQGTTMNHSGDGGNLEIRWQCSKLRKKTLSG